ncbi:hypothetical protein JCGZ_10377 [Jatropha curcas]|uniref:Secreted protein n=1 Tax=Jatropha curcas TaxID=180498 RepID=A0A067KK68_JATCU|nr:hypothetical protein JCGZ_10377 [Jatropha curcas]
MRLYLLRVATAALGFAATVRTERERVGAMPPLRPPGVAGERRKRLRRGPDRGKVAALPATVALAGIERREGWRRRSCYGEEVQVLVVRKMGGGEGGG